MHALNFAYGGGCSVVLVAMGTWGARLSCGHCLRVAARWQRGFGHGYRLGWVKFSLPAHERCVKIFTQVGCGCAGGVEMLAENHGMTLILTSDFRILISRIFSEPTPNYRSLDSPRFSQMRTLQQLKGNDDGFTCFSCCCCCRLCRQKDFRYIYKLPICDPGPGGPAGLLPRTAFDFLAIKRQKPDTPSSRDPNNND